MFSGTMEAFDTLVLEPSNGIWLKWPNIGMTLNLN